MSASVPQLLAASGGGHPLLDALSAVLIVSGLMFFLGATVGIVRFPDFYTRMHAAGKGDTLSTVLITAGMAIHVMGYFDPAHWTVALVAIKVLAIGAFIMLTSPTSTHALMKAGFDDGIEPELAEGRELLRNLGGPFLGGVEPAVGEGGRTEGADPAAAGGTEAGKEVTSKPPAKKPAARKAPAKKKAANKKAAEKKAAGKKAAKKGARKTPAKKAARRGAAERPAAKKAPRRKD